MQRLSTEFFSLMKGRPEDGDRRPEDLPPVCGRRSTVALPAFRKIFLPACIILLCSTLTQGQNSVRIVYADSIVGGTINDKRVQKIFGNVLLQSDSLTMHCDSAYQFVNESEFRAFGNIEINTPDENIWADMLVYFTDIDFSQLRGRVIIEADSTTLFGNSVDYRFSSKVAHFIDQVRLEDQQGVLIANSGFYYREADSAVFRGRVQLADSLQYLEGDSLFSNRQSDYYEIYGNIFAHDRENKTMLKGQYLEADSTGRRLLKGNAWLKSYESNQPDSVRADTIRPVVVQPDSLRMDTIRQKRIRSDNASGAELPHNAVADTTYQIQADSTRQAKADTTHIRAKKILSTQNRMETDTTTTIFAYHDVRIWSPKFSAVADTARYEGETETFELWSNPIAWHENVQLTGPYIKVLLQDGDIEQLSSFPNPFSVQQDTSLNRLNQIKGDTLKAFFEEGNLSRILVRGNSHLLRFTKNEEGKPDGAIDMTAPVTRIFFENGEPDSLRAAGPVDGSYLPESEQTASRKLDGFTWKPKLRPRRPEKNMEPRFPPIPKERPFPLPRRYLEHIQDRNL